MTDLHALVQRLRECGVAVRLEGDQLAVRAPKGALSAELAAELRANKERLIEFLREAKASSERQQSHIGPADPEQRDRVSDAQQRLWFLYQLEGPTPTYNMPLGVRIVGDLDVDRLERALITIAERHETLRTRFVADGARSHARARAVIDPQPQLRLRTLPPGDPAQPIEQQIAEASDAAARVLFLLPEEHAVQARLLPLSDGSHLLLVTLHHIIADGWSIGNLIGELSRIYQRPERPLPPLEIQYADYVAWSQAGRGSREAHLAWWRDYLKGAPDQTPLPLDGPRPAQASYRGAELQAPIEAELMAAIERLARTTESTAYMVSLAGFALFLQRICGSAQADELVIGTTLSNRSLPELEPLIGLFINMLPLRLAPAGADDVAGLIAAVKDHYLAAHARRDIPFERIVEAVNPPRALNHAPIFQVVFDLQNQPAAELTLGACELHPVPPRAQHAKFDLSVAIESDEGGAHARWSWSSDVLTRETVEQWAASYLELLRNLVRDPRQPLAQVGALTPAASRAWLERQRQCRRELPERCWLEAFDRHALEQPERVALTAGGETLSYGALRARARSIAGRLINAGVRAGDRVVVLQERHADLVASLLAVQYSGAAYVPVDPGYPEERLRWVLEDAEPALVLTERGYRDLEALQGIDCLCVEEIGAAAGDAPLPGPTPGELAYLIFTSGSTGRPKGVQIEHRALANFLRSMAREPGLGSDDVLLAVTTVSFDIAGLELFLPLMVGARLVLADRMTAVDGRALLAMLDQHGVTCLQATPSTWRLLLDARWRNADGLKALCGGEALPKGLAEQICATGAELWNLYGPTETTVWSAARRIALPLLTSASGNEPVGPGIDNNYLYVLDERGELAGPGCVGELWIGGLGLARGYWRRPGQTAERYRPDPFADTPGARMYGTGDLVRVRTDGNLDFLGRIDNQVKLRGFRIELGEIESALLEHPEVSAAVALAVGDDAATRQLVAFVESPRGDVDFKARLRQRLPHYMVPGSVEALPALPLTPNGKVDRKALAASATRAPTPATPTLAADGIQRRIAEIWSAALGVASPDIDTNVFDLGAHSLMLAQVQGALEQALGRPIELVELFRHPTIRTLAEHLESGPQAAPAARDRPTQVSGNREIAVIGMAAVLPGAADVEAFRELLESGADGIRRFSAEELRAAGLDEALIGAPNFVPAQGAIDGIEQFDARYFGYSPAQARLIDPQQRLFLQTAVHALENAGYARFDRPQNIGVFGGCGQNDYLIEHLLPYLQNGHEQEAYDAMVASEKDFLTTRVSYLLNLTGPSLDIQTACSSGLVALHVACRALRAAECEMALAGAVALRVPQANGHLHQEGMIVSADGHCRAFDADAAGTVWGSGVVALVLKPLERARADGDRLLAVIKGSAVGNDGAAKVGFTAPGVDGQGAVIRAALADAGVTPDEIGLIEAHGTATALGDMIEFSALKALWRGSERRCALGSVKSQIGHLNSAAGMAGLLKALLAVQHGVIPPSRDFRRPHPKLGFDDAPFRVPTVAEAWPEDRDVRLAGVSSFGIGGTNAHVIVAAATAPQESVREGGYPQVLPLSAKEPAALDDLCRNAAGIWQEQPTDLRDLAWTLSAGRTPFAHRAAVVAGDPAHAAAQLLRGGAEVMRGDTPSKPRATAFLFPGQGAQSAGMARGLYRRFAAFREALDACAALLDARLGIDLVALTCDDAPTPSATGDDQPIDPPIDQTWLTQPALFAVEYALAQLWLSWGLRPSAVMGHSLGEITAACLAGVFDLPTAAEIVCRRGRICWEQPRGSMLAVNAAVEAVRAQLPPELDVAAVNGPLATVVAGADEAVDRFERELRLAKIPCTRLKVSHAFHSRRMAGGIAAFRAFLAEQPLHPPTLPLVSSLTGEWLSDDEATSPDYWADQLGAPIRFLPGARLLAAEPDRLLLEVGPGQVLSGLLREVVDDAARVVAGTSEENSLLRAAATLWCRHAEVDLSRTLGDAATPPRRVALPPYPFRAERHWIERGASASPAARRLPLEEWFSLPWWRPAPLAPRRVREIRWQLDGPLPERVRALAGQLPLAGSADLQRLADDPAGSGLLVALDEADHACLRLTSLLKAWTAAYPGKPLRLRVLAPPLHAVAPDETPDPQLAALRGVVLVAAQEHPSLDIRCIDSDTLRAEQAATLVAELAAELALDDAPRFVAYRHGQRFVAESSPLVLHGDDAPPALLTPGGTYLITGGSGRMGLAIARYLTARCDARVVLVSRRPPAELPAELGEKALAFAADVGNPRQVEELFEQIGRAGLTIDGVFHAAGDPNRIGSLEECPEQWPWPAVATKLDGARQLARRLAGQARFGVLISSLASQLGGLGYTEYGAANAALDALAYELSAAGGLPWVAIDWDAWRFRDDQPAEWIGPDEGVEALDRILHAMPMRQVVVSTLPLAERARHFAPPAASAVSTPDLALPTLAGLTPTQSVITGVWQALLGHPRIGLDDDYFTLGGDSLLAVRIVEALRSHLQRPLGMAAIVQHPTIRELAAAIDGRADLSTSIRVRMNASDGERRIVLLPGTGGGVMYLTALARALGEKGYRCEGLQARGLNAEHPPRDTIEEIAADNLAELEIGEGQEVTLIGHSLGGWVGLEMARQLAARGLSAPSLVALDAAAPAERSNDALKGWSDAQWVASVADNIFRSTGSDAAVSSEALEGLEWPALIAWLHREMVGLGLLPGDGDERLVEGIVQVFRRQAQISYAPRTDAVTSIALIRAEQPLEEFLRGIPASFAADPTWGWGQLSTTPVTVTDTPGNHLDMVAPGRVRALADRIDQLLNSSRRTLG
ncbi:amino acid adenylation domain-containing protein [Endothiovibrio diazotrophicus]